MENGYFERHINRMRKAYKLKRDAIIKTIKTSPLGAKSECLEENSGLHFIMKLKTDLTDEELIKQAKQKDMKISCLSQYCHKQEHIEPSMVIINYSGIDTGDVEKAVQVLGEIVE